MEVYCNIALIYNSASASHVDLDSGLQAFTRVLYWAGSAGGEVEFLADGLPHSVRLRSGHLRNERRRIELQPSPTVGGDVASLVDRRDGAADRLPRVGDAVRLGDDVHQSCELEDP